jgi:ribosomal protein L22
MLCLVSRSVKKFLRNFQGFVTSKSAEKLASMTRQEIVDNMLHQLDEMFANKTAHGLLGNDLAVTNIYLQKKPLLTRSMMKPKLTGKVLHQALFLIV